MSKTTDKTRSRAPTVPKEERQAQLIKATIRSIAAHGLSDTTTATVSREAGLSQGIINLHFQSKDRLLLETLAHVVDEYKAVLEQALEKAGPSSTERLAAMIEADFHPAVCERNKLAVWFAFWSESKARPTYRKLCADRDREYDRLMAGLCRDIVADGNYATIDAEAAARGLAAVTEGLWLDMLINPRTTSRLLARRVALAYLAHVFPRHFETPEREKKSA